jgi:hypothetical protein
MLGDVAHRDIAALGDELTHELAAHPRAATSHDRDPASEIFHVANLPLLSRGVDGSFETIEQAEDRLIGERQDLRQ